MMERMEKDGEGWRGWRGWKGSEEEDGGEEERLGHTARTATSNHPELGINI
jgi:hypothetical protein